MAAKAAPVKKPAGEKTKNSTLTDPLEAWNWPFGTERNAIQGFLRSLVPELQEEIEDHGHGVALYPPYLEGGPPRQVQPDPDTSTGYRCSGLGCQKAVLGCVHIWMHRFFLGDLKDMGFCPPIAALRVREPGGVPYESVERYLPRPNARIGAVTARWLAALARRDMPERTRLLLGELAQLLRMKREFQGRMFGVKRSVGRPTVDTYDVAVLAVLRMMNSDPYTALDFESTVLLTMTDEDGDPLISSRFKFTRVNEAMTGYARGKEDSDDCRLTRVLEEMVARLLPYFRDITEVTMCDGMVLSTAQGVNSRRGRGVYEAVWNKKKATKDGDGEPEADAKKVAPKKRVRSIQTTAHLMYDPRWGFITAWRLTWHACGRGSGESPQFPYLLRTTLAVFPKVRTIMADMAYGSDRNHRECLWAKVWLVCALKPKQFQKETKYLTDEQAAVIRERNSTTNVLFRQLIPFRNLVEACNSALRHYTFPYLVSRPDRSRKPALQVEKLKENPNRAESLLPEDQDEREQIIETEQFVSRACHNEMLCRQIVSLLRAVVRAERYYECKINLAYDTPFQHRPEDVEFTILRPRLDPSFVAA